MKDCDYVRERRRVLKKRHERVAAARGNERLQTALSRCDGDRASVWAGDLVVAGPLFGFPDGKMVVTAIYAEDRGDGKRRLFVEDSQGKRYVSRWWVLKQVAAALGLRFAGCGISEGGKG